MYHTFDDVMMNQCELNATAEETSASHIVRNWSSVDFVGSAVMTFKNTMCIRNVIVTARTLKASGWRLSANLTENDLWGSKLIFLA